MAQTKSKHFDRIKRFYSNKLWTLEMVRESVNAKAITEAEYKEITGKDF